jgi:hypothetical protein
LNAFGCHSLEELSPNNFIGLTQLQHLDVSKCGQLKSIVGIVHATALQKVDASNCRKLRELPDNFSDLMNLKKLDLSWDRSICKLPENYKSLATYLQREGILIVKALGCSGLIVPLVEKLRGAETSRVRYHDACNSECDSMQAWVEARKKFDGAAYHLLKQIIPPPAHKGPEDMDGFFVKWEYMLDASEVKDVIIRALCEHDSRGSLTSKYKLCNLLERTDYRYWWVVVATTPCTLAAVTKRAMLEP